jgi:REP element-mobilizing transposase RayT
VWKHLYVNHIALGGNSENNALEVLHNHVHVNWSIPARVGSQGNKKQGKERKTEATK